MRLSEERLRVIADAAWTDEDGGLSAESMVTLGEGTRMARELLELRADLAATTEDEVKFRAKWSDAEAEVERLRDERDSFQRVGIEAQSEVERLREALRSVIRYVPTDHLGLARAALKDSEAGR